METGDVTVYPPAVVVVAVVELFTPDVSPEVSGCDPETDPRDELLTPPHYVADIY